LLSRKRADILRENYESLFQQSIAIIVSNWNWIIVKG